MFFGRRFDFRTGRQVMVAAAALAVGSFFVNNAAEAQTTSTWTTCAQEGGTCSVSGTRNVRYGAGSTWATRQVTSSIACTNSAFGGDPIRNTAKSCQYETVTQTTPPPSTGWTHCASENALCSFTGTRKVRYGADTRWATRDVVASNGGVQCTNGVFGDPAPGTEKTCQLEPVAAATWSFCSNENALCSFTGTRKVRYGADTRWATRDIAAGSTGGVQCRNSVFGDPAPGTAKHCEISGTSSGGGGTTQQPPTISGTPASSVTVGSTYRFQPTASDPNGDALTFSITNRPTWATFNTTNGLLTGQPTLGNVGSYANIQIRVTDGTSTTSLPAFAITVAQDASGTASLSWTPPTTNTDGSSLTNLSGYRIYYGTSSSALTQMVQVNSPGVASYVMSDLGSGTYYFAIRAYNSTGSESSNSNVVSKTIP